jgi:hypothetical protein
MPRTMSRAPTATLMTRAAVETALPAPPKRVSPAIPTTAQVVKYPSARAPALARALLEPRSKMVSRSRGGAIEPPVARIMSPGRGSLMSLLPAVEIRDRSRRSRAGEWHRRAGYHRFWVPLPTQAPVTLT